MRYLGLALYAEGKTDYRFLRPLLRRATEYVCCKYAKSQVEISDIHSFEQGGQGSQGDHTARVLELVKESQGSFNIIFLHTDGAGDHEAAFKNQFLPIKEKIKQELSGKSQDLVAVVPVREMEAWTLADGDALRLAFETTLNDRELGIPIKRHEVEKIFDPKQVFNEIYGKVTGGNRRRRMQSSSFLEAIGEQIQLVRLREIPAFQRFETQLHQVLIELGYIDQML